MSLTNALPTNLWGARAEDEHLLDRIRCYGDEQALGLLFKRYYNWLCQQALSFTGCYHQSEEIVSDVFNKMWRSRADLSPDTRIKAYLFIAVRNQSLDYLRKSQRRRALSGTLPDQTDSGYVTPEEDLLHRELFQEVETAIEKLPPQGRQVFRLSRDGNLKYREIAQCLGISIKTVETHMRRAFIHLRQEIRAGV